MIENPVDTSSNQFVVIDSLEEVVGRFDSEEAASQSIEQCKKEDAMYETAKIWL